MGLAIVHSRARAGVHAPPVRVEVHLSGGLPRMTIVGLPATAAATPARTGARRPQRDRSGALRPRYAGGIRSGECNR